MGWLARSRGLSANSVTAVEIVTADGRLVRADQENEPDLFWAVRGGGGNFGVVTAIEIALYEEPELYAGAMFWPVEQAAEVLHAWREWTETVPHTVTSVGRILHFPPIPDIPEPMRGNSFVLVEAVYPGSESEGAALVAPLRGLGPAIDTFAAVPPTALQHLHMDPPKPVPGIGDGMFLDAFPSEAVDAMVATGVAPLLSLEVRQLGGALAVPSATYGAAGSIDAGYVMFAVGLPVTHEMGAAINEAVTRAKAASHPGSQSVRTSTSPSAKSTRPACTRPRSTGGSAASSPRTTPANSSSPTIPSPQRDSSRQAKGRNDERTQPPPDQHLHRPARRRSRDGPRDVAGDRPGVIARDTALRARARRQGGLGRVVRSDRPHRRGRGAGARLQPALAIRP
jgi:hypothetical protein